jgi:hypothetical protein
VGLKYRLAALALGVAFIIPLAGSATAGGAPVATASVTSVKFSGTATHPTVTISGSGFGHKPVGKPWFDPGRAGKRFGSLCYKQPQVGNKNDGRDYGPINLGVNWVSGTKSESAGIYSPGHYLDCIGLVIKKYTATKIVVSLGSQYALYGKMAGGDKALVEVRGTIYNTVVSY